MCGVGDEMEHLESVAAAELETVTKENCSPIRSSPNGQSGHKYSSERSQGATAQFVKRMSSDKCWSDRAEVGSLQKVSGQTSELPLTSFGTDFVQASRPSSSVLLPDARRRPVPYNFAGTRHESYGNLGIAGLAGLSTTSATLALLPLQASGQSRVTTVPSPPVTTSSVVTSTPMLGDVVHSSGSTSLDLPGVGNAGKLGATTSNTAASVRDRRNTFFSEPPKPISLPTRSASELYSLRDEGLGSETQLLTNVYGPAVKESNGPSLSVTSVPSHMSGSGSFSGLSTATTLDTRSSQSSVSRQQEHPVLAAESSLLCPDIPHTVSAQRDVSPMQISDKSASVSDNEDTNFSVWCGPPPDDTACLGTVSTIDTCIFEIGKFLKLLSDHFFVVEIFMMEYIRFFVQMKKFAEMCYFHIMHCVIFEVVCGVMARAHRVGHNALMAVVCLVCLSVSHSV